MTTIYAKQIRPEHQESPFFMHDPADIYPGVIFKGNRLFNSHTTPEYDAVFNGLDALTETLDMDGLFIPGMWYENFTEAVTAIMPPPVHKPRYSTRDIKTWRTLASDWYNTNDQNEILVSALQLVTGKEHVTHTIRGCVQSDWQEIIFPAAEYDRAALRILEADYFNTGTEWIIHDESSTPETPEDISGYSIYCYGWNMDQIRAEIAAVTGCETDSVILYEYAGSISIPKYNKVEASA